MLSFSTSGQGPAYTTILINNAPAPERQYLGQVHELLLDMAKSSKTGARNAFVFNFRTGSCIYYDLDQQRSCSGATISWSSPRAAARHGQEFEDWGQECFRFQLQDRVLHILRS